MDVGNLLSGSSAFSKSSLYIWQFSVHVLFKSSLKNCEHYIASLWNEYNCVIVWTYFGIAFLWDWNENWPFPVLWPLLSFPDGRGTIDQIANIHWIIKRAIEFQKNKSTSALLTTSKSLTMWITINWKILQEMVIPGHLTCLLRNLYVGQEATVRTLHRITGSKLGKECNKAVYCHPAYLT